MTAQTITASDLYTRITTAFISDASLEKALLSDLCGTVRQHFGVTLQKPAALEQTTDGFRLTYDGQNFDLGDPRKAAKGELNDAELELVSGGGANDCPDLGGLGLPPKPPSNIQRPTEKFEPFRDS